MNTLKFINVTNQDYLKDSADGKITLLDSKEKENNKNNDLYFKKTQ